MTDISDLKRDIAASLYLDPRSLTELQEAEFLKHRSIYGISLLCNMLDKEGALYYRGETMHIMKSWAKKHLVNDYELDFRTESEKQFDGMSDLKIAVIKAGLL